MNNPLVQPDPGLFIWTIVTFMVLVVLLRKFAWKPMLAALEHRRVVIAGAVEDARKAKDELERVQKNSAAILAEARVEAEAIAGRVRADMEQFRVESRQKAVADAAALVKTAERDIQLQTTRAVEQIRREAIDLSVAIASKLLQRNVSAADNDKLLDEMIKQVEGPRN